MEGSAFTMEDPLSALEDPPYSRAVLVSGLGDAATVEDIHEAFEGYRIHHVELVPGTGHALVTFLTAGLAEDAATLNNTTFRGNTIQAVVYDEQKARDLFNKIPRTVQGRQTDMDEKPFRMTKKQRKAMVDSDEEDYEKKEETTGGRLNKRKKDFDNDLPPLGSPNWKPETMEDDSELDGWGSTRLPSPGLPVPYDADDRELDGRGSTRLPSPGLPVPYAPKGNKTWKTTTPTAPDNLFRGNDGDRRSAPVSARAPNFQHSWYSPPVARVKDNVWNIREQAYGERRSRPDRRDGPRTNSNNIPIKGDRRGYLPPAPLPPAPLPQKSQSEDENNKRPDQDHFAPHPSISSPVSTAQLPSILNMPARPTQPAKKPTPAFPFGHTSPAAFLYDAIYSYTQYREAERNYEDVIKTYTKNKQYFQNQNLREYYTAIKHTAEEEYRVKYKGWLEMEEAVGKLGLVNKDTPLGGGPSTS